MVAVVATCCSVFGSLALHYGHALVPPPPLGRHETVGTVAYVSTVDQRQWYAVGYSAPRQSDFGGFATGPGPARGNVAAGQSVVVRYDPADVGTVVAVSAPGSRMNGAYGLVALSALVAASSWCWVSRGRRRWRRLREEEDAIDYRQDAFGGTSMSA